MSIIILPVILVVWLAYWGISKSRIDMDRFKSAFPAWIMGAVAVVLGGLFAVADSAPCKDTGEDMCGLGFALGAILAAVGVFSLIYGIVLYFGEDDKKEMLEK